MSSSNRPNRVSAFGSPRRPASVQHGVPLNSFAQDAPAAPGEDLHFVTPTKGSLHASDGDAFNIDPATPYLDSGVAATQPASPPNSTGSKRFIGGFVNTVKQAMHQGEDNQAEQGRLLDPDARTPPPDNRDPTFFPPHATDPHGSDDGTTVVDHKQPQLPSPVSVSPPPASDYAKMEDYPARTTSISSFTSYLTHIRTFFNKINNLPWVADRVTIDYVPGEQRGRRQAPVRKVLAPRPMSWYGDTPAVGHHSMDLFSETTSPTTIETRQFQATTPRPGSHSQAPNQPPLPRSRTRSRRTRGREPPPYLPPGYTNQQPQIIWQVVEHGTDLSNVRVAGVVPHDWHITSREPETQPDLSRAQQNPPPQAAPMMQYPRPMQQVPPTGPTQTTYMAQPQPQVPSGWSRPRFPLSVPGTFRFPSFRRQGSQSQAQAQGQAQGQPTGQLRPLPPQFGPAAHHAVPGSQQGNGPPIPALYDPDEMFPGGYVSHQLAEEQAGNFDREWWVHRPPTVPTTPAHAHTGAPQMGISRSATAGTGAGTSAAPSGGDPQELDLEGESPNLIQAVFTSLPPSRVSTPGTALAAAGATPYPTRPVSIAPSTATGTRHQSRPPSAAPSAAAHVSCPPSAVGAGTPYTGQSRSVPLSAAAHYTSRPPSASSAAAGVTPRNGRPPSVAASHASHVSPPRMSRQPHPVDPMQWHLHV